MVYFRKKVMHRWRTEAATWCDHPTGGRVMVPPSRILHKRPYSFKSLWPKLTHRSDVITELTALVHIKHPLWILLLQPTAVTRLDFTCCKRGSRAGCAIHYCRHISTSWRSAGSPAGVPGGTQTARAPLPKRPLRTRGTGWCGAVAGNPWLTASSPVHTGCATAGRGWSETTQRVESIRIHSKEHG